MFKKILILDDDQDILQMLKDILTQEGHAVEGHTHTDNIFTLIEEIKPDLLIVDYFINGLNGGEICSEVKRNPATAGLPVIILTGFDRVLKSLGDYSADLVIAKPFDVEILLNAVDQLQKV
ncbi:MAG: response regulator [Pedobacter sp.]|nr:MAG: response regulator [Pedobacter sp.]